MAETCQIIVTLEPGPTSAARLAAVLAAIPVATVVVSAPAETAFDAQSVRALVEAAQKAEIAALVEGDANLARALRADGVYLPPSANIQDRAAEAREILGTRYIVGAGAGKSRHDAMSLGESGVEFVAFGVPADVQDVETARERRFDLIDWWAAIFEVPCVAFDVTREDDAEALAAAGADFIAVPLPQAMAPADVAQYVTALRDAATAGAAQRRVEA